MKGEMLGLHIYCMPISCMSGILHINATSDLNFIRRKAGTVCGRRGNIVWVYSIGAHCTWARMVPILLGVG